MPTESSVRPAQLTTPLTDSPFLETTLRASKLGDAERTLARQYAEDGYVVIDLGLPDFEAVASSVIRDLAPLYPEKDRRVAEAWYFHDGIRRIACAQRVLDVLRALYQRDPIPFQTLNFDAGTQQPAHSDTLHFHCVPHHYMAGVWAALQDIEEGTGELFVVPGSHKWRTYDMFDLGLPSSPEGYFEYEKVIGRIIEARGATRVPMYPKKGQAIIWHANLLHGGMPFSRKGATRHSQATHYYFDDCMYYFPMGSDPYLGKMVMREVIDIRNGRFVPHKYRGVEVDLKAYENVLAYPRPLPDWVEKVSVAPSTEHAPMRHAQTGVLHGVKKTLRGIFRPAPGRSM